MVEMAEFVCSVAKVRWPVSAMRRADSMVEVAHFADQRRAFVLRTALELNSEESRNDPDFALIGEMATRDHRHPPCASPRLATSPLHACTRTPPFPTINRIVDVFSLLPTTANPRPALTGFEGVLVRPCCGE